MEIVFDSRVKKIVFGIQALLSVIFVYMAYATYMIPMEYVIGLTVFLMLLLVGEYFLIFYKIERSRRIWITQIISVLLSCVLVVGSFYFYKMTETVNLLSEAKFQTRAFSVIVLKDSKIHNENQLDGASIGYISAIDAENMTYAVKELQKNIKDTKMTDYKDFHALLDSLYNKKVDAILLDESFRSLVTQDKDTFTQDTRVIYQITKDEGVVGAKNVNVTQKPFIIYISGIDEYGDLSVVSRSDVNMLVAVNPITKQILLVSIPRDTYFPLHTSGGLDKFTHAGVYGLDESIFTLEDMINEEINYYVRMNFTSFIDIVDALGGVAVDSPQSFRTKIGNYEIKEGSNNLNSEQALAFVRERKSFLSGDFERGRNQQRMMVAIMKKICSPAILTSFSSVLETISQSTETNFSNNDISALMQMQLSEMITWDIQTYQIEGATDKLPCYSLGGLPASVVVPTKADLQTVQNYIKDMVANNKIQIEKVK